jgi:hypothetical protein
MMPSVRVRRQEPGQEGHERRPLVGGQRAEEHLLRLLGLAHQLALQRFSLSGERDPLAPAVFRVACARHEAAALDLVEVADQVAAVEPEPVREVVLGERPNWASPVNSAKCGRRRSCASITSLRSFLQRSLGAEPTTVSWVLSAFLLTVSAGARCSPRSRRTSVC